MEKSFNPHISSILNQTILYKITKQQDKKYKSMKQAELQQRQLTSNQKEFLLEFFFKNEKYAGWRNVAEKLLEKGQCTVAGKTRMWIGGIGNFINIEDAKDAIDCSLYIFDLEHFMTSEWYKDIYSKYISILYEEKLAIDKKYKEMTSSVLMKFPV